MPGYYWCSRCQIAVSLDDAPTDRRGDAYCPGCGASAAHLMQWGYARSLYGHFPDTPESGELYCREAEGSASG